jgi:hypothetical protein
MILAQVLPVVQYIFFCKNLVVEDLILVLRLVSIYFLLLPVVLLASSTGQQMSDAGVRRIFTKVTTKKTTPEYSIQN